jgi:serine/threonine protein phosphatase PrpC
MSSRVAYATSTGLVRRRNEDSAYVGRWLCAVADGMGGHAAGDIASTTVVDAIRRFDVAVEDPRQITMVLGNAVREANERLTAVAQAEPGLASMGSTMTAMFWSGSSMVVAHIGDSRAYRLRTGLLKQVTEDHVMSKLVASPMPSEIGEYLVRFLDGRPGWSPDLTPHEVLPGDRYLICSDGLSSVLSADAIQDVLASIDDIDEAVEVLIRQTHELGAPDNVTLIVVDLPDGTWQERKGHPIILGAAASLADVS